MQYSIIKNFKRFILYGLLLMLLGAIPTQANESKTDQLDARIRQIFAALSKEKDLRIQQLEARIQQLCQRLPASQQSVNVRENKVTLPITAPLTEEANFPSIVNRLAGLGQKIADLQQAARAKGLSISRFFNFNTLTQHLLISKIADLNDGFVSAQHAATNNDRLSDVMLDASVKPSFIRSNHYFKTAIAKLRQTDKTVVANTPTSTIASSLNHQPDHSNVEAAPHPKTPLVWANKLDALQDDVKALKLAAEKNGLNLTGYVDVKAKTDNAAGQNFNLGYVELDMEYAFNEHVSTSSALVFDFNTNTNQRWNGIAVALIDYHLFNDYTPPRGRIFSDQGFHIQAGRFDLPFSTDYQNFANTDRVTISAPITTSRMQFGGFYGTGLRSYGSWKHFNYAAFWTDAIYAADGSSVGGHLGINFGQNTYRSHRVSPEGIELGISHLSDLDKHRNLRHSVYGADLSIGYGFLRLQSEFMWLKSYDSFIAADNVEYGKPDEFGYHATLIADLEKFIDYPVLAIARFGRWEPHNRFMNDYDGRLVAIDNVSALTFGLNYTYNEHLNFKLEYTDSLGTSTQERYFNKQLGTAQLVVSF